MEDSSNGKASAMELHITPKKLTIVGEPGCGKTTFLNAFYRIAIPESGFTLHDMRVSRCTYEFHGRFQVIELLEIPSDFLNADAEGRIDHYSDTDIFIFMFDLSDKPSFYRLRDKWFPEAVPWLKEDKSKVVILANKKDIGNNVGDPIPFEFVYGGADYRKWITFHRELCSLEAGEVMSVINAVF